MAKKRIIVQKLLADAPKGRRQKVNLVLTPPPADEQDVELDAAVVYIDGFSWPLKMVDQLAKCADVAMLAMLIGVFLGILIWKAKHGGF